MKSRYKVLFLQCVAFGRRRAEDFLSNDYLCLQCVDHLIICSSEMLSGIQVTKVGTCLGGEVMQSATGVA